MKSILKKRIALYLLPIIFLLGCVVYLISLMNTMQSQIDERDRTIQQLAFSDSLVNKYFQITTDTLKSGDTLTTTTSYTLKDEFRTREIERVRDIHHYTTITEFESQTFINNNDTLTSDGLVALSNKQAQDYNKLIKDYNNLVSKTRELATKYNETLDSLQANNIALDLIHQRYNISYKFTIDNNLINVSLQAAQADSAFMLLPYYRNKLKYDMKKKVWIIK